MCPHSERDMAEEVNGIRTISENVENDRQDDKSCVAFEDAMTMTGFGKFNVLSIFFIGFVLIGMILETLGFSYIIPACQCDLDLTLAQKGWLAAIPFIGIIITSHAWGYIADTRGRKMVLVYSMGIGSFFSILSSFSPDLITFAALRFIASLFISAGSSIAYAYLGELNPKNQRDIALTVSNGFVAFGTAIVPLISWAILPLDFHANLSFLPNYRPWRLLVAVFALPYAIGSVLFFYFPQSPKYLINKGESIEALQILKNIYAMNTGKSTEDFPVKQFLSDIDNVSDHPKRSILSDVWNQTVPLFKAPYLRYTIITCFLQFCTFAVTNGFYIWFPTVINKIFNAESTDSSENMCSLLSTTEEYVPNFNNTNPFLMPTCDDTLHTSTFPISIILSCVVTTVTIICAFLLKRIGKRNILIAIFFVIALCSLAIHWVTDDITSILLFSSIQISGTCIGIINAYVVEIFPTNVRAMAVCLTLMVGRVGSVFGTNVIGYLIDVVCPASFFLFGGLLLSCTAVCFTLPTKPIVELKRI